VQFEQIARAAPLMRLLRGNAAARRVAAAALQLVHAAAKLSFDAAEGRPLSDDVAPRAAGAPRKAG
jgi:hypothetical protein